FLGRGDAKLQLHDPGAIEDFDRALALAPEDNALLRQEGLYLRGCAKRDANDLEGALADLDASSAEGFSFAKLFAERARVRILRNEPGDAIVDATLAVSRDPLDGGSWLTRGSARQTMGDVPGA